MRIVYIGTVDFSYFALKKVIEEGGEVVGIFTKGKSDFNSDYKDLTPLAKEYNIPIFYIDNINSSYSYNNIKKLKPDIIFCFGWSQLIKKEILNIPKKGVIGFHPAKLPYNRGRHPLIWALFLGLEKSGVTFFKMNVGADTGEIISQKEFEITYEDDAKNLYKKIKNIAASQISDFLPKLKNETINYVKQDIDEGNSWRKRGKADGKIDWRMSSRAIYNLVRALTNPYVGAHCEYQDQEIKVWKVEEEKNNNNNIEPGKILCSNEDYILVKAFDGAIKILEHEFNDLPQPGEYLR